MGTLIGSLLTLTACAFSPVPVAAGTGGQEENVFVIEAGAGPLTVCLPDEQPDPAMRTILQIESLEIGDGASGYIEIAAPGIDPPMRIGLFPLAPFSVERGDEPRRFLLSGPPDQCREVRLEGEKITATFSLLTEPAPSP